MKSDLKFPDHMEHKASYIWQSWWSWRFRGIKNINGEVRQHTFKFCINVNEQQTIQMQTNNAELIILNVQWSVKCMTIPPYFFHDCIRKYKMTLKDLPILNVQWSVKYMTMSPEFFHDCIRKYMLIFFY